MAARRAAPQCTNGHGPMAVAADQSGRPIPVVPGVDHGSAFIVYECRVCAYREFHDSRLRPKLRAVRYRAPRVGAIGDWKEVLTGCPEPTAH